MPHSFVVILAIVLALVLLNILLVKIGLHDRRIHEIQFTKNSKGHVTLKYADEEIAYWETRVRAAGGVSAYAEFADSVTRFVTGATPGTRLSHGAAHIFGEALYKAEGLKGFSVCGREYGQGCLHAFFGFAMQDLGIVTGVSKLGTMCAAKKDNISRQDCEHGLGHGILGYLGYNTSDLLEALSICDRIGIPSNFMLGCGGGIFMEYNIRLLLRDDGVLPRIFSADTAYHPCDQLTDGYKSACVFWLPTWWRIELFTDTGKTEKTSVSMGQLCEKDPFFSNNIVQSCFGGIGYIIPQEISDPTRIAESCAISSNTDNRLACWHYAVMRVPLRIQKQNLPSVAQLVCSGLKDADYQYCIKKTRF